MRPILFNTDMVRAILDGRKTVTRRVVKPQPAENPALRMCSDDVWRLEWWDVNEYHAIKVPICIGDILYVRETWCEILNYKDYRYKATDNKPFFEKWRPSIHMPKEAARIFLRVTGVRVERLQDITPEQIDAEGFKEYGYSVETGELMPSGPSFFMIGWDKTIKPEDQTIYGWSANPWVWAISFERISKEDALK